MAKKLYVNFPDTPGVYIMKDHSGKIIYVGKAGNLMRRVSSYFQKAHDIRIERLVSEIRKIDYQKTDTVLEALILESELIKKYEPLFNVREKDNKSFLYVEITKESFPRVLLVRGRNTALGRRYGPFTSASQLRDALKILRRIFPWSMHSPDKIGKFSRPCLDYELGLCPGTCVGLVSRKDYLEYIHGLNMFLGGEKVALIKHLKKEMMEASKKLDYEKATKFRSHIFALQHIHDTAFIFESPIENSKLSARGGSVSDGKIENSPQRIEGYDISNISGTSSVGSMVVFTDGEPDKNEYRKFRIRTITQSDDVGMLKEVLERRLKRIPPAGGWTLPNLILIDGGKPQVNAAKEVLIAHKLMIPIIGLAKGPERKRNDLIGKPPPGVTLQTLIQVRDEAHRFAISYHRTLRGRNFMK